MLSVLQENETGSLVGFSLDFSTSESLRAFCYTLWEFAALNRPTEIEIDLNPQTGKFCMLQQTEKQLRGFCGTIEPSLVPSLKETLSNPGNNLYINIDEDRYSICDETKKHSVLTAIPASDVEVIDN